MFTGLAAFLTAAAPDGITFAPLIIVQTPPQSGFRTWLPVGVALLSAAIAAMAAWLSWRNQVFGFAKDAAAIAREFRGRQTSAALVAFDNSVGRPVGMALDLIERLSLELSKLRPVPDGEHEAAVQAFGADNLDDKLLAAGGEALSQATPSAPSAIDAAIDAVVRTKLDLRRLLEVERRQEGARWLGSLDTDPFFTEVRRWLPKRLRSLRPGP